MNLNFFVRLFFISLILFSWTSNLEAQQKTLTDHTKGMNIPAVVAKVNGEPIEEHYIRFKFNRIADQLKADLEKALGGSGQDPQDILNQQKKKIIHDVIDKEIIRELLSQEAKKAGETSDPKLIEQEFTKLKSAYSDGNDFEKALKERNLDVAGLKKNIGIDLMIERLVEKQVRGKIKIKKEEVEQFYEKNKVRFNRPESYRARHIYIPHFTKEMFKSIPKDQIETKQAEFSQQAWESAKNILAEIRGGADFAKMAEKYSKDLATAKNGGDLGFMYKGVFPPSFDEVALKLKPNEIGDVVKTPFGFHIVQLVETKPADTAPFADVEKAILQHLLMEKGQKELMKYSNELRKSAKIEMLYGS